MCHYNNGWYIYDVDFSVEPFGGYCSLSPCGVEPPKPRESLEKDYFQRTEEWLNYPGMGGAAHWWGGLDNPKYAKEYANVRNRLDTLRVGGHILDEHGVLLPEFRR